MQRVMLAVCLVAVGLGFGGCTGMLPSCGALCNKGFLQTATPAQITAQLDQGARINGRNLQGNTPLHLAATQHSPNTVTWLLQAGANVHATDGEHWQALHYAAAFSRSPQVLGALLHAGAKPNARSVRGNTPLHWAAFYNRQPAMTARLLKAQNLARTPNHHGNTPLHLAAGHNPNPAISKLLLQHGSAINAYDALGHTPLHLAASNTLAVVRLLIQRGGNVNARNNQRFTPLHLAAKSNSNPAVIKALLQAGANPAAKSNFPHITPWDYAQHNQALRQSPVYQQMKPLQSGRWWGERSPSLGGQTVQPRTLPGLKRR